MQLQYTNQPTKQRNVTRESLNARPPAPQFSFRREKGHLLRVEMSNNNGTKDKEL